MARLERLVWLIIGIVIAGCLVWQTVSDEVARRETRTFMEMAARASMGEQIVSSEIVREVPVERVPVRAIPGSGEEIVTGKVTNIVPPDVTDSTLPSLCESIDLTGVGPGTEVRDLAPGVYTATICGDTFALDVTMESVDGRSRFTWGRTESVSFAVGDHGEDALYPGPTRVTVNPPGPDVRWGIDIERLVSESDASIRVEVVGDEAAIADLSPGLWRVDLLWTSGEQPSNWVWDGSYESVEGSVAGHGVVDRAPCFMWGPVPASALAARAWIRARWRSRPMCRRVSPGRWRSRRFPPALPTTASACDRSIPVLAAPKASPETQGAATGDLRPGLWP